MISNSFALCHTDQTVPGILNLVLVATIKEDAEYKEKKKRVQR